VNLRILVVDDHDVVRRGLRSLVQTQPGWQVCAEAATGRQAVTQAIRLKPDLAVLDLNLPDLNGLEVARRLRRVRPGMKILVLTVDESEDLVNAVLEVGARGFVLKADAGRDLLGAIESISKDRPYFTSRVAQMVLEGYLRHAAKAAPPDSHRLSAREREIVQLLAEGLSNKEVSNKLNISVKTAESHRSNIMHKLGLHTVGELTRYAVRHHMIEP